MNALAEEIRTKTAEQVAALIARNWSGISTMMEDADGINLSFKVAVDHRTSEAGQHPDKDNRIKTTISFSKRVTDSIDGVLEDGAQGKLPFNGPAHTPKSKPKTDDEDAQALGAIGNDKAGQTSLGDALNAAASQTQNALLDIDLGKDDWEPKHLLKVFRGAAKKANWTAEQISTLADVLKQCTNAKDMVETLKSHCVGSTAESKESQPAAEEVGTMQPAGESPATSSDTAGGGDNSAAASEGEQDVTAL